MLLHSISVSTILPAMKADQIRVRIEPSLKRSFESAATFSHQSLSQFILQAGIAAVERAREKGLGIKAPPEPRDGRRRRISRECD
jgi:hypothetical protein